jgi:hypothetical protein
LAACAEAFGFRRCRHSAFFRHSGGFQQRELVKPESSFSVDVIPAQAGIHFDVLLLKSWIRAFAGMTIKKGRSERDDRSGTTEGGSPKALSPRR